MTATTFNAPALTRPMAAATSRASLHNIIRKTNYKMSFDFTNDSYINSKSNYFGANQKSSNIETVGVGLEHLKKPFSLQALWFYSEQEQTSYYDVPELSYKIVQPHYKLWLGRHRENWSQADSFWQFGYWQPRFNWDGFHPTEDGLTGLFFEPSTGSRLKMTAFVTPFFIPETDPTYHEENNMLVSQNPWFRNTPPMVALWEQLTPVHMNVDLPSISSVVFKPSVAYKVNYRESPNSTLHFAYAYKPMNTPVLGFNFNLAADASGTYMNVNVVPRFDYHHIATVENIWHFNTGPIGSVAITPSLTYDSPQLSAVPYTWVAQNLAPLWIGSLTASWNVDGDSTESIYGGVMNVWGNQPEDRGQEAQPESQFPLRPRYLSALRVGFSYSPPRWGKQLSRYSSEATFDPRLNGWELLNEYLFSFNRSWQARVRADFLGLFAQPAPSQQEGFFALYRSNSVASLDVAYVF